MSATENVPVDKALRILVVDDVPSARRIVVKLLQKLGFSDVTEANGGREALKALEGKETHLIICDWQMPDMEGIELLACIRKSEQLARIPFIMITSNVERENVVAALEAGASDYILKPFNFATLSAKVQSVLAKQGPA